MADEPRINQNELMALTQSYMPTMPATFEGRGAIIPRLAFDLRDARRFAEELCCRAREVTCVWCGHQFATTLEQQREHLLAHAEICEQSPYRDCRAQLEAVTRERDEEKATVSRIWRALGISTYEQAGGKEISEIVNSLRVQLDEVTKAFAEYGAHRSTCYAADPDTHWSEEMIRTQCDCGYVATAGRVARDAAVKPEQP